MTAYEAAATLRKEVKFRKEDTIRKRNSRLFRAAVALRNAEIEVLRGNPTPSAPGGLPGLRSGKLMANWSTYHSAGGENGIFGIVSAMNYAGYLENGTKKMASRPFVNEIQKKALPKVMAIFETE